MHRLREFGKHVVGVGTRANASQRLVSVCSEYKFWGTIVASVEPASRPAVAAAFDIGEAERLLLAAFDQIPTDTPTASTVKSKMLALDPSFDQAKYGCASFRDFLHRFSHRVKIVGRSGQDITVRLLPEPALASAGTETAKPGQPQDEQTTAAPPRPPTP